MIEVSAYSYAEAERLDALDLETFQIERGLLAPRIVCASTTTPRGPRLFVGVDRAVQAARVLLQSPRIIAGANIAYDFGCLAAEDPDLLVLIFQAYEQRRVFDVQIAQALHAIAEGNLYLDPRTGLELQTIDDEGKRRRGRYSLERCVDLVLGRNDAKRNDFWRRRYALLAKLPVDDWPEDARQYPLDDASNTWAVAYTQIVGGGIGCTPGPHRNLDDLADQCETAFALHLGAIWGLRTDRERTEALRRRTEEAHTKFVKKFKELGFFDEDGERNTRAVKRAVIFAYGGGASCPVCVEGKAVSPKSGNLINCTACSGTGLDPSLAPRTKAGGVCADRDSLMESGDPDLVAFGDNEPEKIRETYLPFLEEGLDRPITLRPNILVASGRTSYDGLIQLLPRDGGVRECIAARPGTVFCSVDYSAMELCTLAQVMYWIFDRSTMMDVINATGNPGALHAAFGASLAGISTEEMLARLAAKDEAAGRFRQAAKAGNFGFPGGMGAPKFVFAKRKKSEGVTETPDGKIKYPGIRFCILLRGADRCGVEKVTEWKGRACPAALCKTCVEAAEDLRAAWFRQWPDMRDYFAWVTSRVDAGGEFPCLPTGRVRGGCDFTNGANNGFQALASDAAKRALRLVTRAAYGVGPEGRESILYQARTRPVWFTHDAIDAEMLEEIAHVAGPKMAEIMVDGAKDLIPNVTVKAEAALMRFISKKAGDPVFLDGKLVPYEDWKAAKEAKS